VVNAGVGTKMKGKAHEEARKARESRQGRLFDIGSSRVCEESRALRQGARRGVSRRPSTVIAQS
jgi:hypothetical protein